jgi:hypothetical protein
MSAQVILQSLFNYKASVNEEILASGLAEPSMRDDFPCERDC